AHQAHAVRPRRRARRGRRPRGVPGVGSRRLHQRRGDDPRRRPSRASLIYWLSGSTTVTGSTLRRRVGAGVRGAPPPTVGGATPCRAIRSDPLSVTATTITASRSTPDTALGR